MARDEQRRDDQNTKDRQDPIDERLIDEGERSPEAVTAAAREAFERDQRENPDHPTRVQRQMEASSGVQNPSHSRGSDPGSPAAARPTGDERGHGNRDRSDLRGAAGRPSEQTGETGAGRSDTIPPAPSRTTPSKEGEG